MNGIKRLADIKLEEEGWLLTPMESCSQILDKEKVVVDASFLNECTLGV
jgi:hypothetical protein